MMKDIKGLHHITSIAGNAAVNNKFFTETLGLRRVKKTVNFDQPDTYHFYYGDETGSAGTVMTYFPFAQMPKGRRGTGEVGVTEFAVPKGALPYWENRLITKGAGGLKREDRFGEARLHFAGPDGDGLALVESDLRDRSAWTGSDVPEEAGILGFNGARMHLKDTGATAELLQFMGYQKVESDGAISRYVIEGGNGADTIDLEAAPKGPVADEGAGSVHHIAFAVENRAAQDRVRRALMDTGYQVTPVIDRDYFWAIYFRTPGGVLFEIATHDPGFERDEDRAHLGEALKLPQQYEPFRAQIEDLLPSLAA